MAVDLVDDDCEQVHELEGHLTHTIANCYVGEIHLGAMDLLEEKVIL